MKKGSRELSGFLALGRVVSFHLSPDDLSNSMTNLTIKPELLNKNYQKFRAVQIIKIISSQLNAPLS